MVAVDLIRAYRDACLFSQDKIALLESMKLPARLPAPASDAHVKDGLDARSLDDLLDSFFQCSSFRNVVLSNARSCFRPSRFMSQNLR